MKKLLPKISILIAGFIMILAFTLPHQANASWLTTISCVVSPIACAAEASDVFLVGIASGISNIVLSVASWFLSVVGIILNISIILTMNIKALYQATPAIDQTWLIIRNLSSIFIMFALLFTSIQTILDVSKANVKDMVGKIIMVGLLINFSLFFTKTAIDASNLVSLQFYRAIVPGSERANINVVNGNTSPITNLISGSFGAGGLSDVFMYNLKISKIYNEKLNKYGLLTDISGGAYFKILVSTLAGSALMIMAAGSFLAASLAFIARIVILLLLLAFSPVYFVGMIFPQIEQNVSKKWEGWLIAELTFMPVYLLFMYVALSFISTINPEKGNTGFMAAIEAATNGSPVNSSGGIMLYMIGILLQYAIAFILISIPLIAAVKTGGASMDWGLSAKKWVNGKLKSGSGFLLQHSAGRGAKALQGKINSSDFASRNPNLALMASKTVGNVAKSTFGGSNGGYDTRNKNYVKSRQEFLEKSIKINDEEKKNYIEKGKSNWEIRNAEIEKEIKKQALLINDGTTSEDDIVKANKLTVKLKAEKEARDKAAKEGTKDKHLQEELLKAKKETAAENMEKWNILSFGSNGANKEAADAFRKESTKGEDKKLMEALKKLTNEQNKPESGGEGK